MDAHCQMRQVVYCITGLSVVSGLLGAVLLYKGFQGGELLVGSLGTGLGGLIGVLSSPRQQPPGVSVVNPPTPDAPVIPPKPEGG